MTAPPLAAVVAAGAIAIGAIGTASLPRGRAGDRNDAPAAARAAQEIAPLFTTEGGPIEPGAPPLGLASTAAADCATCHAEIAAEWADSAHARSWTDPIFQAEYRLTRQASCRHCHAPRAGEPTRAADDDDAHAALGIDCTVCHVRAGHVLGAHGRGDGDHAAQRDARLATTAFCGACHQFDFPVRGEGQVRYHPGRPLQNTVVEWQQSRYADRPCQACHMPLAGAPGSPHKSHAFRALDDPATMARAVRVTADARRRGRSVLVAVEIATAEIGHAFPTGDMFRQAVLTVRAGAAGQQEILTREFAQTITGDARGHLLGQVDDTRVPPPGAGPPVRLAFVLDAPRATEVTWSLDLFRLAPDDARARGLSPEAIRVPVRAGRVAIAPR